MCRAQAAAYGLIHFHKLKLVEAAGGMDCGMRGREAVGRKGWWEAGGN